MGKSLKEKLDELSQARQECVLTEGDRLNAEHLTIQELRKARRLTQVRLARELNVRQAAVAQMERQSDLLFSTLRSHVEAMGGKLSLMVKFSDRPPVALEGLCDSEDLPGSA